MRWHDTKALLLGIGAVFLLMLPVITACGGQEPVPTSSPSAPTERATPTPRPRGLEGESMVGEVGVEIFTPHFVNSSPRHGQFFRQAPEEIVINFNFTLHEKSAIKATKEVTPLSIGDTSFDSKHLAMRARLGAERGDGFYLVEYTACWPDGSCHNGNFGFHVDSDLEGYTDLTGQSEVRVNMQEITFQPTNIVVSRGTKVIWENLDGVTHFVNSDPHPSHNVLPGLNSLDLGQGTTYSFTFDEPGEWSYHCSAHFPQGMVGRIIVQP